MSTVHSLATSYIATVAVPEEHSLQHLLLKSSDHHTASSIGSLNSSPFRSPFFVILRNAPAISPAPQCCRPNYSRAVMVKYSTEAVVNPPSDFPPLNGCPTQGSLWRLKTHIIDSLRKLRHPGHPSEGWAGYMHSVAEQDIVSNVRF